MKIGVVGLGVVGAAVHDGMKHIGHVVIGHDIKNEDSKITQVLDTDICFIAVPTKTDDQGVCDTSKVEDVLRDLEEHGFTGIAAIKSTIVPGTTDRLAQAFPHLRLAFCPEFLRERVALSDFLANHDVCAIGAYRDEDYKIIKEAHGAIPRAFAQLTPTEAELLKYFANTFNSLRIVFANEFYEVATSLGADYSKIKDAAVKRDSISDHYLDCNEQMRGYAGVCLPKDTYALATFVENQLGLTHLELFKTIHTENKKFRPTVPGGMRVQ